MVTCASNPVPAYGLDSGKNGPKYVSGPHTKAKPSPFSRPSLSQIAQDEGDQEPDDGYEPNLPVVPVPDGALLLLRYCSTSRW
jgi:hypothetical protein